MAHQFYGYVSRVPSQTQGVNDAWDITTLSLGKMGSSLSDGNPFLIANEWICGSIGQFLRLPIPAFALLRNGHEQAIFASLHFGVDAAPDDLNPLECAKALTETATGLLLFDILIANSDRHAYNLNVDREIAPTKLYIFDHEHALFGAMPGDEMARLDDLWDRLGVTGGPHTRGNRHCLLSVLNSAGYINQWINRIYEIPDRFIDRVCYEPLGLGITVAQADKARGFLKHRRRNLEAIIRAHEDEFEAIPHWDWGLI